MTCPICNHESIPRLATSCPKCASSLVGLRLIDSLEEQYVELLKNNVNHQGEQIQKIKTLEHQLAKKSRRNSVLWGLLFLLPLIYYFCGHQKNKAEQPPVIVQNDSLNYYKNEVEEQAVDISSLKRQLRAVEGTMDIREIKYKVEEGDRLYDLGLLFYNDTAAWYQIALDNNIYDVRGLPKGDTITIRYRD